ncbi:MAG: hypothetical protein MJ094_02465 [Saccharofermentans sp.]|nr:hypothetical protein [Saccharofermentans sp.]
MEMIKKITTIFLKVIIFAARIALAVCILYIAYSTFSKWDYIFNRFDTRMEWNDSVGFEGHGTSEDPYLIQSTEDFILFADEVNDGGYFTDVYFLQTVDVDLEEIDNFHPIGALEDGYSFRGVYDGGGHRIYNLKIDAEDFESKCASLFGMLEGTVMNLGIESGRIEGEYAAGFAICAGDQGAVIINCYNNAYVHGDTRGGGIVDNFYFGKVINCANFGHVSSGGISAQICSFDCEAIIACVNNSDIRRPLINYESVGGQVYDCYVGNDISDLNFAHSNIDDDYIPDGTVLIDW